MTAQAFRFCPSCATPLQLLAQMEDGGEKQRLALARGVYFARSSDVVLLDEPTSSVDSRNERMIYENIFRAFREQSILSSIHRLHLLQLLVPALGLAPLLVLHIAEPEAAAEKEERERQEE